MEYLCNAFSRRNPLFIGSCSDMALSELYVRIDACVSQSPLYRVMQ